MKLHVSDYSIAFGSAQQHLEEFLQRTSYSSVNVIVDNNTEQHCLPKIIGAIDEYNKITIPSGEQHKTLETCHSIWAQLQDNKVDRHALVINLGGGVIGDMGGFAASTYMRGVDFLQIPTTLLSQVDASVGGKLGVDFRGLKNFIGLFTNPKIVIVDSSFFDTLPLEELRSGYGEMIKHALIQDKVIWNKYVNTNNWKDNLTDKGLYDSVNIKKEVVIEDPFEKGLRKILNFGHTLGHAIETYSFTTDHPLYHGHAIALGMLGEAYLSEKFLGISPEDLTNIKGYIDSVYQIDTGHYDDKKQMLASVKLDKKNKAGKCMFSLLNAIGDCHYNIEVGDDLIMESLDFALS